jgi:hypothetical protein
MIAAEAFNDRRGRAQRLVRCRRRAREPSRARITSHRFARSKRDFVVARARARVLCKKIFGAIEFALSVATRSRRARARGARARAHAIAMRNDVVEKCPFHGHFSYRTKFAMTSRANANDAARERALVATIAARRRASASSSFTLPQRDSDFFDCCGTNRVQCTSIRTARIATHSLLGGQHGEESEEGKGREEKEEEG